MEGRTHEPGEILTYDGMGRGWGSDPATAWFVRTEDGERWTANEGWSIGWLDPDKGFVRRLEDSDAEGG